MIEVCLLGTGGMMPLPGRALTALYARCDGRAVLVDCGEGTQTAVRAAGLRFSSIDALLFTHFHADHISGLPGMLLTIGNEGRTRPLDIYGPKGLAQVVSSLCVIVCALPFEMIFHELPQGHTRFACAGFDADAFPLEHGMPCLGYRFAVARKGKFDPQRAKEKEIPLELWSRLQAGESVGGFTPEDVLGEPRRGLSLLYATDTRPAASIEEYGREADLLILEGMFGEPEKQERAEEKHHMMMQEAAQTAKRANARELWLTHFSPATPHPEEYADELCEIFPNTVIGSDGMQTVLHFDD